MGQKKRKSFANVVEEVAGANQSALMAKARTANRLAKITFGQSRRRSYETKVRCLRALVQKFGPSVQIRNDRNLPAMLVIAVEGAKFALHAPRHLF